MCERTEGEKRQDGDKNKEKYKNYEITNTEIIIGQKWM